MSAKKKILIRDDAPISSFIACQIIELQSQVVALKSMLTETEKKKVTMLARRHFDERLRNIELSNPGLAAKVRAWCTKSGGEDGRFAFRKIRKFNFD